MALNDSINLCQCGTQTLALSSLRTFFPRLSTALTQQLQTALTLLTLVSDVICALKKFGGGEGRGWKQVRCSICYYFEILLQPARNSRIEKKRHGNTQRWSDWGKSSGINDDWRNRLNFPLYVFRFTFITFDVLFAKCGPSLSRIKIFNTQFTFRNNIHGFFNSLLWIVGKFPQFYYLTS